jgi:2-hydroxychromene-2-carboxylate isomerase
MQGAVAAEIDGNFAQYVEILFHHMWEEPQKMDDPDVICTALDASGLDGARMLERIQDPAVKERLLRNTEQSVARGAFGSPTFFCRRGDFLRQGSLARGRGSYPRFPMTRVPQ